MRILVTGAAGYVGSLLTERLLALPDVSAVIATDLRPRHGATFTDSGAKLAEERGYLENRDFMATLEKHLPIDAVVHAAFHVRTGYGKRAAEIENANIENCRNVFSFCFRNRIERLIYFSSAAVYGARADNKPERFFGEDEPLREKTYPYGAQKRETENMLQSMHRDSGGATRAVIVRPCSITGPRFLAEPTKKISLVSFLKKFLPVIPKVSDEWARQYIHEEDLFEAIRVLLMAKLPQDFDSFNLAPDDYLTAVDIAHALGKRTIKLPAWLVEMAFSVLWHTTRGGIPTPSGSIDFYRHPINLDGRKITRLGFSYRYSSRECLLTA